MRRGLEPPTSVLLTMSLIWRAVMASHEGVEPPSTPLSVAGATANHGALPTELRILDIDYSMFDHTGDGFSGKEFS
jgi:hypothetical protein